MVLWRRSWFRRWLGVEDFHYAAEDRVSPERIRTHFSSTVFTGGPAAWVRYLERSRAARYDGPIRIAIQWSAERQRLAFRAENEASLWLADALTESLATVRSKLSKKASAARLLDQILFGNPSNAHAPLCVRSSATLPSEATREVERNDAGAPSRIYLVLRESMVATVRGPYQHQHEQIGPEERLGLLWPVARRILSQLAFPSFPRDRFVEKIRHTADLTVIALHILYTGKQNGRLVPSPVGACFERYMSRRDNIPLDQLYERHPYFRLLGELAFVLDQSDISAYDQQVRILVREYLDSRYLRLSLAGLMPEVTEIMAPMPFIQERNTVSTPLPRLGSYGILDHEDLEAWHKLERPLREMGYTILRQLGIGEFGRVYEAINRENPHLPPHVAIKVDRYRKGRKKEAIQAAEVAMRIGSDLAASPHVIRVFDAGKIPKKKYTYHVLQLVDGDTLDNLLDITGEEHASVCPPHTIRNERDARMQFARAMRESPGEAWRRRQVALPFIEPLTLGEMLDLLTSVLLWLEEIHGLGYAINDLKNGNLMVSRRGQLKGIDMDAYSRIRAPSDKVTDFYFLAVSVLFLLLNCNERRVSGEMIRRVNMRDADQLADLFTRHWSFEPVERMTQSGATRDDVIALWVDLATRCRDLTYVQDPERFSDDINRLIRLRRDLSREEIVLD